MAKKAQTTEKPRPKPAAKRHAQQPAVKSGKSKNKIIRYFQETRDELRKVTWPSREETTRLTVIVLVATFVFALALGFLDFAFQRLTGLLITI